MSFYPTTNMKFTFAVTLKANEEFVRLKGIVENPTSQTQLAEAWVPMTYPIENNSKIISPQRMRWKRDNWCFLEEANMVAFPDGVKFEKPLAWNGSGIFYDFPYTEGGYHAVNVPSKGIGVAYVTHPEQNHYMKLWSWGNKSVFDRDTADELAKGRPATEYYEPWGSGFNFAFFQKAEFEPYSISSWDSVILPIDAGLEDNDVAVLRKVVVDNIIQKGVVVAPIEGPVKAARFSYDVYGKTL